MEMQMESTLLLYSEGCFGSYHRSITKCCLLLVYVINCVLVKQKLYANLYFKARIDECIKHSHIKSLFLFISFICFKSPPQLAKLCFFKMLCKPNTQLETLTKIIERDMVQTIVTEPRKSNQSSPSSQFSLFRQLRKTNFLLSVSYLNKQEVPS